MAVIKGLGLENFRIFDKMTEFEFAPMTILTGANNSGKSSLIKALLLLADNAKKNNFEELDFSGDTHHLDSFEYVKNRDSEKEEIAFSLKLGKLDLLDTGLAARHDYFSVENSKIELIYKKKGEAGEIHKITIWNNEVKLLEITKNIENKHHLYINFRVLIEDSILNEGDNKYFFINKQVQGLSLGKDLLDIFEKSTENYFSYFEITESDYRQNALYKEEVNSGIEFKDITLSQIIIFFKRAHRNIESIRLQKTFWDILEESGRVLFSYNPSICVKDIVVGSDFYPNSTIKGSFISLLVSSFLEKIAVQISLEYIECFKANSRRIYLNQFQGTGFNELLLKTSRVNLQPEIQQFIIKWLKEFKIGEDYKLYRESGVATKVKIIRKGVELDLVDLGFGYTQVFPLILQIALCAQDNKFAIRDTDIPIYINTNIAKIIEWYLNNGVCELQKNGKFKLNSFANEMGMAFYEEERYKNKLFSMNDIFSYFTILVEEPEANLHPKFQSKLADLFLDASNTFGFQFIIETHSEYLIRRLQILVAQRTKLLKEAENKDKETRNRILAEQQQLAPDAIRIYYFYEPDQVPPEHSQIEKISILADGRLDKQFGEGFFDEATNLQVELLKLKNRIN